MIPQAMMETVPKGTGWVLSPPKAPPSQRHFTTPAEWASTSCGVGAGTGAVCHGRVRKRLLPPPAPTPSPALTLPHPLLRPLGFPYLPSVRTCSSLGLERSRPLPHRLFQYSVMYPLLQEAFLGFRLLQPAGCLLGVPPALSPFLHCSPGHTGILYCLP